MGSLEGKVAVVTGSGRGIGRAAALLFGKQGAKVVVNDLGGDRHGQGVSNTPADEVVAEIKANGGEAVACHDTVATMEGGENIVNTAINTYGKIDILVNNAGILRDRMTFNMTEDEWDGVIATHLKGCFTATKFASIYWRQTRTGGSIIYFSSLAGIRGGAGQPNYSAAHAGKIGLMLSTANALGRYGVRVNCISPGASTRMTDRGRLVDRGGPAPSLSAEGTERDPKNVVPPVVYLASDAGSNITGRIIGAVGHKLTMWREPTWDSAIYSETPVWDIDELFRVMPETLGAGGWHPAPPTSP